MSETISGPNCHSRPYARPYPEWVTYWRCTQGSYWVLSLRRRAGKYHKGDECNVAGPKPSLQYEYINIIMRKYIHPVMPSTCGYLLADNFLHFSRPFWGADCTQTPKPCSEP